MRVRIVLLTLGLALAAAAPANAWKLERKSLDGLTQLVFTSDLSAAGENLVVAFLPNGAGSADDELQFANNQDEFVGPTPVNCVLLPEPNPNNVVECLSQGVQRMTVFFSFENDFWKSLVNTIPTTVHGGSGNDSFDSRDAADTMLGEGGNDFIEDFSNANDADILNGGAGDDELLNGDGADDIRGGDGNDSAYLGSTNDVVTLDDVANDGGASGEDDNIRSDVENVDGGSGNDRLTGDGDANRLDGGSGDDELYGGGGSDDLIGGRGADLLSGGSDFDRVTYPEAPTLPLPVAGDQRISLDDVANDGTEGEGDNVRSDIEDVFAGPGNDIVAGNDNANTIDGGDGADDVTGGGSVDVLLGGAGVDVMRARDGLSDRVECNADGGSAVADTVDTVLGCAPVDASDALVPDVDGDGSLKPADCDDHSVAIRPGATDVFENGIDENCDGVDAINLDRDGDGHARPSDCDDTRAAVHPGARDVPGNRLDEDCSGRAEPYPRLRSTVRSFFAYPPLRFTTLTVVRAVKGSRIELRCRGGACFKRKALTIRSSRAALSLLRHVRRARLRRGATVEIRVTRRNHVGVMRRVTARGGSRAPRIQDFCLPVGGGRPTAC
jgi:Ca2+-binding RTX toxin-like protein